MAEGLGLGAGHLSLPIVTSPSESVLALDKLVVMLVLVFFCPFRGRCLSRPAILCAANRKSARQILTRQM